MADLTGMLQAAAGASTGNPNAWDVSKAVYDAGDDAWDISKATYAAISKSVTAQDATPLGVFFKPDGTKMYVIGITNDAVYEYTLSSPWIVNSATYVQNFSVATEELTPQDLFFKPDGTKMYVVGSAGDDVNEYTLSTAWDISSASYVQNFSVATEELTPTGLFFKPDGTKMYICGSAGDDVNEYDLSTAWDISSASYLQNFSVASQELGPTGVSFKADGTKMYIIGSGGVDINEYDLSTPWDVSTSSYVQNFSVSAQESIPQGVFFKPDGSMFYVIGNNDIVYQYVIGGFSVASEETSPNGMTFKDDGTKMYICGSIGDDVNEYDLSTAWDITTASYLQNFSVAGQEAVPTDLAFKTDGTKMYVIGQGADNVYQYDLSSAWDVSTASYVQSFSVVAKESTPRGLSFKTDGTVMYIVGISSDSVHEYALSTAWDISSATFTQTFSVAAEETQPTQIIFKPDGTKMYVTGDTGDDVNEYDLSTPWDISTASYLQNAKLFVSPRSIYFRDNGEEFFVLDIGLVKVVKFSISPT